MNDETGRKFADWRWFLDQNYGPHVNREMNDALDKIESEIDRLEAQRNELLAALKNALRNEGQDGCLIGVIKSPCRCWRCQARAAIAKVKPAP